MIDRVSAMRMLSARTAVPDPPAGRTVHPAVWLGMAAVVLVVALLTPVTGDDWRRVDFGDRTVPGFVGKALEHYRGRNGRLAGNTVSYVLMEPLWLRVLAKSALVVGLVAALHRVTGGRSSWHAVLCFVGIFVLPAPVFRQSLGWSTGFFYYVPPLVGLVLLVGTLAGCWPRGPRADTWAAAVRCAVLGAVTCLFIEHVTVAVVLMALGGLALTLLIRHRPSRALVGWAVGALGGTTAMLLSPGLRGTAAGQGGYYGAPGGAWVDTVVSNYGIVTRAFVLSSPVVMAILAAACLVHAVTRLVRTRAVGDLVLVLVVLLVSGYAVARQLWLYDRLLCAEPSAKGCELPLLGVDLAITCLLLGVLVVTGLRVVPDGLRAAWAWLLVATLLMLGPLLLVSPIGPRNLYGPLVTVVGMVAITASPLLEGRSRGARAWQAGLAAVALVGVGAITVVHWANGQVAAERVALMEEAVAERRSEVVLPDFPHPRWVHGADDEKIGYRYYLERRNDIEISFGG